MSALSRRGFLGGLLAAGGALSLGVTVVGCGDGKQALRVQHADQTGELMASLYITVKPDGRIALTINKAEIGQGVTTGYITIVAEEIGVPLDHIDAVYADSHDDMRDSFGMQITGGSTSTMQGFGALRHGAAAAREMLIAAAAQQWKVPASECVADGSGYVTHEDRRVGYGELTKLAAHLPVPAHPKVKERKDYKLVGKVDRRVDARAKVTGKAQFGIDFHVDGMVNAHVIHGPVYGASPTRVTGDDAAKKRPGVIDVLALPFGVAVVASKYWQARAAAADLAVEWTRGDTYNLDSDRLAKAMREYHDGMLEAASRGNSGKAIERAPTKLTALYEAPYLAHAPMEPQNATVKIDGDHVEVWAPTQSPTIAQAMVAHALDVPPASVTIHVLLAGGGFGRRAIGDACVQAALIARAVNRPVKLTWTRESDMTQGFYRPVYTVACKGGIAADGAVSGVDIASLSQSIPLSSMDLIGAAVPAGIPAPIAHMVVGALMAMLQSNSVPDMFSTEGLATTKYTFADLHVAADPVQTKMPVTSWRSVGNSVTGFVMESFVDELAHAAKADAFAFRRKNLPTKGASSRACSTRSRSCPAGQRHPGRASAAAWRATSRSRPRSARSSSSRSSAGASRCAACTASSTAGSRSTRISSRRRWRAASCSGCRPRSIRRSRWSRASCSRPTSTPSRCCACSRRRRSSCR